jgi:hypothetical protein
MTNGTKDIRKKVEEVKKGLEEIKKKADLATPKLEETVSNIMSAADSVQDAVDTIIPDKGIGSTIKRFIRRMLSREAIIAAVAVISIWGGQLDAEQAIGVAVAASSLILGRSAVKARNKKVETKSINRIIYPL